MKTASVIIRAILPHSLIVRSLQFGATPGNFWLRILYSVVEVDKPIMRAKSAIVISCKLATYFGPGDGLYNTHNQNDNTGGENFPPSSVKLSAQNCILLPPKAICPDK